MDFKVWIRTTQIRTCFSQSQMAWWLITVWVTRIFQANNLLAIKSNHSRCNSQSTLLVILLRIYRLIVQVMPIVSKLASRNLLRLIEQTIELRGDRIFHLLHKMRKESDQTVLSRQHPSFLLLLAILLSMVVDPRTKSQIAYK